MTRRGMFKQHDLARATKAVRAAGLEVARVLVAPDGTIIIEPVPDGTEPVPREPTSTREWELPDAQAEVRP